LDKADWARKKGRQRKDILTVLAPFTKVRMKSAVPSSKHASVSAKTAPNPFLTLVSSKKLE